MAMNSANVTAARQKVAGVFYGGATSATLPTNATTDTALASLTNLGHLSSDGIEFAIDKEVVNIDNMSGDTVLTIGTSHSVSVTVTPIEFLNEGVMKEMFGESNVTSGKITVKSDELPNRAYVFDMALRDNNLCRIVLPNAKVSELGSLGFRNNEAVASEWTIEAMPDANGAKAYIYIGTTSSS